MVKDVNVKSYVKGGLSISGDPGAQVKKARSKKTATTEQIVKNIKG